MGRRKRIGSSGVRIDQLQSEGKSDSSLLVSAAVMLSGLGMTRGVRVGTLGEGCG